MKKIIMVTGGVETLTYFARQIGETLQERGNQIFYLDITKADVEVKKMKRFIKAGNTIMVTFNFQGLEKEDGVYDLAAGYVWESYHIPCYNIAVDHPFYYHERLRELPQDYHHISIDMGHQRCMQDYYPQFDHTGFLPLAGNVLTGEQTKLLPIRERAYDVVFTGNYTPPSFCHKYINFINEEYAQFYWKIIHDMLEHPELTMEVAFKAHCTREMGEMPNSELTQAFHNMIFIDLYLRNYTRGEAIRTLVDAGVKVHVWGSGWQDLECEKRENLIREEMIDSAECVRKIQNAKISLNVLPWFREGPHDRIFNTMLGGAVCVTDGNAYLRDCLIDGEDLCYFDLKKMEELPELVTTLLADEENMQRIANQGYEKAAANHTWRNRAQQLAEWIGA